MDRRQLLVTCGTVLTAGLAGCSGDGDNGGDETTTEATATETATETDMDEDMGSPTPTATETATSASMETTAEPAQTVTVAPGGSLSFDPETFEVAVGDTVKWEWDAAGHNVKASSTPDGAEWTGTPGGDLDTFDGGHTYSYTFEVAGDYEYYCAPHQSAGMEGSFTVTE